MKNTYFSVKPGAKGSEFYGGGNSQGLSDKGTKYQGTRDEGLRNQVPSTNYRTTSVECSGNHPVITLLSPRNHPLLGSDGQVVTDRREVLADRRGVLAERRDVVAMMRQKCMMWKYVAMLLAVLMLSIANIGMAWGETETLITTTYGTTSHGYLDVANTTSNGTITASTTTVVTFGANYLKGLSSPTWYSCSADKSDQDGTGGVTVTNTGFLPNKGSSGSSFTQAYSYLKVNSSKPAEFWVTGTTGVAIIGKGNSADKKITLSIKEVAADGTTLSSVGTDLEQAATAGIMTHASTLNAAKYYKIIVSSNATDNNYFYQIRFSQPSKPSTSADGEGGVSEIANFMGWKGLNTVTTYWRDGIKFFQYSSGGIGADSYENFTTAYDYGYNYNLTAGSAWGSYTMSGLATYGAFGIGVSVTEPSLVEIILDNNKKDDTSLSKLSIKKDNVAYKIGYTTSTYCTGTDIKTSKATIKCVESGKGRYKVSISVTASDLLESNPYIIKMHQDDWDQPTCFVFESVTVTPAGGGCSAPTSPSISGTTAYTAGQNISLTASATGTSGTTTYTWYKGADWATASATTPVQAASTSGATFTKASCVVGDAGTYWCNISNGTGCEVQVSQAITVAAAVTTHTVTAVTSTETDTYGTVSAASSTVAEGSTTTITATPATGYQVTNWAVSGTGASISPSGASNSTTTTLTMGTEDATVTATFGPQSYTISYKDQNNVKFSGLHESGRPSKHTYGSETILKTAFKDSYVFGGWYTSSDCSTGLVTSIGATDYTAKVYLYAKWTEMSMGSLAAGTLYKVGDMVPKGYTVGSTARYYPGVSANNLFNIRGRYTSADSTYAGMASKTIKTSKNIDGEAFTAELSFRKPASKTDGEDLGTGLPDNHAIQFKISGDGLLDIYCYYADSIFMVKDGGSAAVLSTDYKAQKVTKEVTAGTYYLYSTRTSSNQRLYGLKFTPTYTVTLNTNGGTINADNVTSYNYGTGATLPTDVTKSGYTFGGWYDNEGLTGSAVTAIADNVTGNKTYWAKWTAAATLTAISADVQYNAAVMANITFTSSDQDFTGLSTNGLFKVYGNTTGNKSTTTAAFGKNETIDNITDDISTKSFTSALYITAANNTSSTSDPTQGAIEFITPSTAGILYLYLNSTSSGLSLKKQGSSTSTSLSGAKYKAMTVDANTHYFINGSGSNRGLYAIKYVSTYAVSITPTNVTKATGDATAIKGKAYTATFTANTGYTLPSDVTVSIGGTPQTKGSGYTWTISGSTATLTVPAAKATGAIAVTVNGVAAATYSITYSCDDAESGCPSNVVAATNLPDPLPSAPTKTGYVFGGWYTNSTKTVEAVAGAALTGNTTLYAKWLPNAVYDPDMSTEAKLTATLAAKFDGSNRWNIGEGIGVPNEDVDDYLTGDKYGLMFPKASVSVTYDLGKGTTLYKITLDIVAEISNEYACETYVEFLDEEREHVDDWVPTMAQSDDPWDKQELTKEYPLGLANVRYIEVSAMGDTYMGLTRFKLEYAPTKTWVVLDNQSATSAGTTSVTATYGASTNLTSSITAPSKTGHVFGGYYTEEAGAGTQLIDENGAWLASKTDYTDGSKNWQFANPDLTLYAKWTPKTTTITLDKNNSDPGSMDGSATATYGSKDLTITHATRTGYTLKGYKTAPSGGDMIIKDDGTLDGTHAGYTSSKTWAYDGETLTLYAQWEANKYNVTHTLSGGVSRSSGGQAGVGKATYGTEYSVVFAAESGYALPAAVTVTVGGSDVTANCTWNQGTGTLTIPAAYVTGDIVITVTGVLTCTDPTTAFADGTYTIGGSALDLSTLISGKQGDGTTTYTVTDANGTGATIAGTSFTATTDGTATVTATQAADGDYCEKVMEATIRVIDPATPIITWTLAVGSTTWSCTPHTEDETNITSVSHSAPSGTIDTGNGTGDRTAKINIDSNVTDMLDNPTNYITFTFNVACNKKLTPDSVVMKVANVGSSSGNNETYKAVLSDNYGHGISATLCPTEDGKLFKLQIDNEDEVYFQGDVTLKVWAWNTKSSNKATAFRFGNLVKIVGTIDDQATPTATIRWTKQPAGGLSGTNETVTAVSSDGSAVTITSNNGSVATVAGSTVSYVGVGSTYLTASGTDACGNTMVSVNSDNFTVIGAYDLSYDANTGTGTMTGETGVHYAVVKANGFTAPSGKVFYGWNTAANGTGDSYQPGDAIELNANTTLYAQWGTELTATWSVTKVDSKLYRGGGGYSVTVYLDDEDWDASGNKNDLELTATEGVTLKNIVKSINGDGKAQVTADFDITTGVDADATSITFTLFVPAAGTYASAELENDVDLTSCAATDGEVYYSYTISSTSAVTNAAATGGTFTSYNNEGTLGSASGFYTLSDNGISKAYFLINTTNTIAIGDKIAVTTNNQKYKVYTADGTRVADDVSTYYTVVADDGIAGTKSFKIGRYNSDNKTFKTFTVTSAGSSGGITPTLSWETDLSGGVNKETGDADFTFTASTTSNTLGAITYSSNNTAVATVNATTGKVHIVGAGGTATITATLAASGCFEEATATYTINVVDNCIDEPGTITSRDLGCDGTELTVSGHTGDGAGATYQWYKVGSPDEAISGARSATYTATAAGEYYVIVTNSGTGHCAMASTNTVTVTAKAAAEATKIVDSWYVKNGRRTPDVALVQSENAESFTVKSGSTTIWESAGSTKTGFGGCGFHMDENGIIYLNGTTDDGSATTGLTAGDETLTITVNGCGGSPVELNITIHKQAATDRKSVAFVVDGTKDGAFDADNESHSVNTALYEYLDHTASGGTGAFDLTAQNIYATTDEKEIREHYSQFDAILITDDPGTKETPSGDYKTKGYVNAFGTMVDVRPILTMEAYVSALANWKTKGIAGEPTSPNPRQYALRLECKDHEIYKAGLPNPALGTHVWDEVIDGQTYRNVILVDSTKSPYVGVAYNAQTAGNQLPALQGFNGSASGNLLGLGRISDGTLQAAIERQKEPAARLLVFSIQAKALPNALTEEGKTVVRNILTYLLKTNMEEVDDCSNYFTGKEDRDWANDGNWTKGVPTDPAVKARILAPCEINSGTKVHVSQVDIATGGKSSKLNNGAGGTANGTLTIHAGGALVVEGKIRKAEAPYFTYNDLMPMDDPERLIINTSNTAQAALIFNNDDADTKATVNLYSLGRKESGVYQFQYMAVPMEHVSVNPTFADETHPGTKIYTYVWQENGGWERRGYYTDLYAFEGVGITTNSTAGHMDYTMTGNLASTATQEITLTKDGDGENIIGNSWMAPINIAALKTGLVADDNVDKTVYIYMTGNDAADGIDGAQHSATATAGQWLAIPIDASGWSGWSGLKVIPAMQAYYIKANAETTLTLDYDNLVRSTATESLNEKLRAPRRTEVRQNDIFGMRMRVADSKTHTDLYLFEDGQFSERYDNGWEAKFMEGDGRSAQFYALNGTDKMAVLATDELEGTFLGFVPGKESCYTISFFGGEGRYYLNDLKTQQSTLIEAGNNYPFTYEAGDDANRFLISRQPFGALSPTGCDTTHEDIKSTKIFYNGTLYIIRAGRIYSAEGMLVK